MKTHVIVLNFKLKVLSLVLLMSVTLLSYSISVHAGDERSGGGNVVFFPNGEVKCLDLVDPKELPKPPVSQSEVDKIWLDQRNRYVKSLGELDDHFFDIIMQPEFEKKREQINKAVTLSQIFTYPVWRGSVKLSKIDECISPSIGSEYQQPVARYGNGTLYISERLFSRLSEPDRNCIRVHEWFRQFKYLDFFSSPLRTEDIEVLTRWFLSKSRPTDRVEPLLEKISTFFESFNRIKCTSGIHVEFTDFLRSMNEIYKYAIKQQQFKNTNWGLSLEAQLYIFSELGSKFKRSSIAQAEQQFVNKKDRLGIEQRRDLGEILNRKLSPCVYYDTSVGLQHFDSMSLSTKCLDEPK